VAVDLRLRLRGHWDQLMNLNDWSKYSQDQVKWKEVVEKAKTFTH